MGWMQYRTPYSTCRIFPAVRSLSITASPCRGRGGRSWADEARRGGGGGGAGGGGGGRGGGGGAAGGG
ncbi:hypothetical protein C9F07_26310, partial [Salmonella enterica subsp. enterica serovar Poona]